MQAGACAYVHKSATDAELFNAIEIVRSGRIYLSKQDSKRLLYALLNQEQEALDKNAPYVLLSPRERGIAPCRARLFTGRGRKAAIDQR